MNQAVLSLIVIDKLLMENLGLKPYFTCMYEEAIKCNKMHTSCISESSKLKLGRNRQNKETMLKTTKV